MTATVCKSTPTVAWSSDRLLDALQSRGWGELDGRPNAGLRTVLNALVSLLPYESAEGRLTRAQVADAAGITPKWAGVCLRRLEDLGVITWRRGWLDHGQPRAGFVRILKTRLAEMVRAVRGYLDERRARRQQETHHRLATTLRRRTVPPWKLRRPLSSRWELSSTLPTQGSTPRSAGAFQQLSPTLPIEGDDAMAACAVCGRAEDACRLTNSKVSDAVRHDYQPGRPLRPTVIAGPHELHPSPHKQQRRRWRDLVAEHTRPAHPTLDLDGADQ